MLTPHRWPRSRKGWGLLALIGGAAVLHFASFDVRNQPIYTDIGYYLYYSAEITRGAVPYVDFFEIKTPGVMFAGAILQLLGQAFGVDPLYAVRVGYLLMAAGAATAMSLALVRLSNNRPAAGWIGLGVCCGFTLLGTLPAIGNAPKMISMLCTGVAMLCIHRRRWFLAGALAGLAFMDWQPSGGITFVAVLLAACCAERRAGSMIRAMIGLIAACIPFAAFFAFHHALGQFAKMIFWGALNKSMSAEVTFSDRWHAIWAYLRADCQDSMWLVWLAGAGMVLFLVRLYRRRATPHLPLLIGLGAYHFGLIVFSLVDFQARLDLFILLGTLAFFSALTVVDAYYLLLFLGRRSRLGNRRFVPRILVVVTTLGLLLGVRPSFLREGWRVDHIMEQDFQYTLADQRQVARRVFAVVGDGQVAFTRHQGLLYLSGRRNDFGFVSWNLGTWSFARRGDENRESTLARLLAESDPDCLIVRLEYLGDARRTNLGRFLLRNYRPLMVSSNEDRYRVVIWVRRDRPPSDAPDVRYLRPEVFFSPVDAVPE